MRPPQALLAAGAILIFLAPVVGLGLAARYAIAADVSERSARDRVDAAALASRLLSEELTSAGRTLRYLAREPEMLEAFRGGDTTVITAQLRRSLAAWPEYFSALALDVRGREIVVANSEAAAGGTSSPGTPSAGGADRSSRDYFIGAMTSDGPFVSEAYRSGAPGAPVLVAVSTAVRDGGRILGVLVVTLPLKDLVARLAIVDQAEGREVMVVDKRSHVIASTEAARTPLADADMPDVAKALAGASATSSRTLPEGERVVTYVPVLGASWALFVIDDPSVVLSVERELDTSIAVAGTVAAAVALLYGVIVVVLFAALSRRSDELARSRAALVQANGDLMLANRHKSEFLSSVSHELRTPMNAILGFTDLLDEQMHDVATDRQQRYFRNVREAGEHLLGLIDDVLDLSRVEAGRIDLRPDITALADLLGPVIANAKRSAADKGIAWQATVADATVCVDVGRVRQVLYNLTSNALKFTPAGGSVTCRAWPDGPSLVIEVNDTGIGIPSERQSRVFGMFERVNEDRSDAKGTGLGLALSKRLVEMHGGTIGFESAEGAGSTFRVTLPDAVVPTGRGTAPEEEPDAAAAR